MDPHPDDPRLLTPVEVALTLGSLAHNPPHFVTDEGVEIARRTYAAFIAAAQRGGFARTRQLAERLARRRFGRRTLALARAAVRAAGEEGHRIFTALERLGEDGRPSSLH